MEPSIATAWYRVSMANPEHLARLQTEVAKWERWKQENPLWTGPALHEGIAPMGVTADLNEADLHGADLSRFKLKGASLIGANLSKASLGGTNLKLADLRVANLSGADLTGADLQSANLEGADLNGANLRETNLRGAKLLHTKLHRADLAEAVLGATTLMATDLSQTSGLATCKHRSPSSIGIDTIFQSRGEIPENFLRGCGVPEQFITYARSLLGQAIEFYSCFISYSSVDQAFAERLKAVGGDWIEIDGLNNTLSEAAAKPSPVDRARG
jgi:hypothetical protein